MSQFEQLFLIQNKQPKQLHVIKLAHPNKGQDVVSLTVLSNHHVFTESIVDSCFNQTFISFLQPSACNNFFIARISKNL